jgi:hypothetical protein
MPGGRRPGAGRPKGATNYKGKSESRATLERRMRELNRRNTETAKKEACRIAVQLLPYDEPRLQAVMASTTIEAGDSLRRLLKEIDGGTVGIARGIAACGPTLALEQSLFLPDQGGDHSPLQDELGADGAL